MNKGSVQLEREVEIKAYAVEKGVDTCETVSVNDQRVSHLSTDDNPKRELIVKDRSGGNLPVGQHSKSRKTIVSNTPISSSTRVTQPSSVLPSKLRETPMNSNVLCYDCDSIAPIERMKVNGQFSEDKPSVNER
ncbi:unnamed protein product, partial [Trichobilharzia regenti]